MSGRPLLLRSPLILLAACAVCFLAVSLSGHEDETHSGRLPGFDDWTMHHVVYPQFGPLDRMRTAERDPRATLSWRKGFGRMRRVSRERGFRRLRRDWSINLGAGGTATGMYPAKFSFDVTAAPSCVNDYAIYPIDAVGSSTQPNIVAFNNLYSGTGAGGTGTCNRTTPPADDDGTDATVLWSYNVDAVGGAVTTSPVISYDLSGGPITGTTVAFVESAAGSAAHFHVLAWRAGDGQDTTDPDGLQNTLKPAQITTFVTTAPAAGSGTATDLALGAATTGTDTLSSPFVDYQHDLAYIGNDIGVLYRVKDVFCVSSNPDCAGSPKPAPSLDTSWGTGGAVTVGGGCGVLTGAVEDFVSGNVFVGCSDGNLYGFNSTGTPLSPSHVLLGDGTTFGGIVDPPIVDGANGFVYAVSGTNDTSPVLAQTTTAFTGTRRVGLGTAPTAPGENLHAPTFNSGYLFSATSTNWVIFSCGYDSTGTISTLYAVGFNASRQMNIAAPPTANQFALSTGVDECSPLTQFVNAPGFPLPTTDWLFLSLFSAQTISNFDVNNVTSSGFPGGFTSTASFGIAGGTSGVIVDNESDAVVQASSIYFSSLASAACGVGGTGFCAVKLTQSGLQ